jgi:hypothetical protein
MKQVPKRACLPSFRGSLRIRGAGGAIDTTIGVCGLYIYITLLIHYILLYMCIYIYILLYIIHYYCIVKWHSNIIVLPVRSVQALKDIVRERVILNGLEFVGEVRTKLAPCCPISLSLKYTFRVPLPPSHLTGPVYRLAGRGVASDPLDAVRTSGVVPGGTGAGPRGQGTVRGRPLQVQPHHQVPEHTFTYISHTTALCIVHELIEHTRRECWLMALCACAVERTRTLRCRPCWAPLNCCSSRASTAGPPCTSTSASRTTTSSPR